MAQKKRKKRKVFLSFLMILFCGVVLSTSTYAWFTANTTVTVQDITVNVATSSGIQISVDAKNWKTLITNNDIINVSTTDYANVSNMLPSSTSTINPVSTVPTSLNSDGWLQFFTGSIEASTATATLGENILVAAASPQPTKGTIATSGDYVAFDIFLSTTQATPIYFTSNTRVTASGDPTGIQNAARVAFVVEGNAASGSGPSTYQALATTSASNVYFWEPNFDTHIATGITNATDVYGQAVTGASTVTSSGSDQLIYYGVKSAIAASSNVPLASTTPSSTFERVTPSVTKTGTPGKYENNNYFATTASGGIPTTAYKQWITLQAGVTKVRVYMWVEGQDVDCENNASGGSITYSIQLSVNENAG